MIFSRPSSFSTGLTISRRSLSRTEPEGGSRRIVVTGATRGIGRAMALGFAGRGHTVYGCGTNRALVESLRAEMGVPHEFVVVDVADDLRVRDWAETVLTRGVPDLLVNNAAIIIEPKRLWDATDAEIARILDVNVRGVVSVLRHFVPAMVERGRGTIVNISSGWGRSVDPLYGPYIATKWAIEGLTRTLAEELPRGMAAVALNPGCIDTDMLRTAFGNGADGYPLPEAWARRAVPYILGISPDDSGRPMSVPFD